MSLHGIFYFWMHSTPFISTQQTKVIVIFVGQVREATDWNDLRPLIIQLEKLVTQTLADIECALPFDMEGKNSAASLVKYCSHNGIICLVFLEEVADFSSCQQILPDYLPTKLQLVTWEPWMGRHASLRVWVEIHFNSHGDQTHWQHFKLFNRQLAVSLLSKNKIRFEYRNRLCERSSIYIIQVV